jgi:hypothetical protein
MPPSEPPRSTRSRKRKPQPPSSTARQNAAFGSKPARPLPTPKAAAPSRPPTQARPLAATPPKGIRAGKPVRTPAQKRAVRQAAQNVARQAARDAAAARARDVRAASRTGGNFDVSQRPAYHPTPLPKPLSPTLPKHLTLATLEPKAAPSDTAAARTAKRIGHEIVVGADNHYYAKVKRPGLPDRHIPVDPFTGKADRKYQLSGRSQSGQMQQAAIQAPALKALDQTTRLLHGVMASTREGIRQHGGGLQGLIKSQTAVQSPTSKTAKAQRHAFQRGLELKDRSLGSDVLKDVGVKNKAVAGAAGFGLDVLASPTTYVTGGTGSVAEAAGLKAARRVASKTGVRAAVDAAAATARKTQEKVAADAVNKALRAGVKPKQAAKAGRAAAEQHVQDAQAAAVERFTAGPRRKAMAASPTGRGVTVHFAGQEIPGVRRGTAAVARGTRKLTRKAVGDKLATDVPAAARNVLREVAPRTRAPGATHEQSIAGRSLARSGRARVDVAAGRADLIEADFVRRLKPEDKARVVDAIERGNLSHIIAPTKKARDKLAKDDPKEFARRKAIADNVHLARSQMKGEYRKGLRAGAIQKQHPAEYLTKGDLGKLDRSVAAEQRAQKKAISRSVTKEQGARERALVTEAVGSPTGLRAGQAATRYERHASTTHLNTQKLKAAQNIPTRSLNETPEAYLRRVHAYAVQHDLPLVKRRAESLLARKSAQRARGYYPHITQQEIRHGETSLLARLSGRDPGTGQASVTGGTVARTARETRAGKRRVETRPLNVVNPEREAVGKAPYSTDAAVVIPNYIREVARSSQPAEFAQGIAAQVGRHLKPGDTLNQGEELYRLGFKGGKYGLHKETGKTVVPARPAPPKKPKPVVPGQPRPPLRDPTAGQYVALPSNFFENIEGSLAGTTSKHNMKIIQGLDATQNLWKRGAITTLAFHIRNMIGDIASGYYLPGMGGSLPKVLSALKVTRRAAESHRFLRPRTKAELNSFQRAVLKPNNTSTIKVAGRDMALDDFVKLGVDNGVPDTGRIARDIIGSSGHEAQLHAKARGRSVTRPFRGRVGNRVNVWMTSRENVMRWAAFKHGLDRGMTPAEAADMASLYHIDYGEMSSFEREVLRRAMPFYTWTSRSLPVAAKTAIQRPGKFANLEAAREETGQAFSGDTEQKLRDAMPDSVKRQVPVVIRVGNSNYAVSASLPVTLLNEFPDPSNPGKFLDEAWHFGFGMVGPYGLPIPGFGIKQAFELHTNKSVFTRRDIRPQFTAGRVPAPEWVGRMPDNFKHMVGAVKGPDKDTGKMIWWWDGRVDYGTRLVPGAAQQASQAAAGSRPGQEKLPAAIGVASPVTGVRVDKLGEKAKTQAGRAQLAKEFDRLSNQSELLNLQGVHSDNPTPEYTRVRARINAINKILHPRKRRGGGGSGIDIGLGGGAGPQVDIGLGDSAGPKVDIGLGG